MTASIMLRRSAAALVLALAASSNAFAQTDAGDWLDAEPIANWNRPDGAIPRAPAPASIEDIRACERRAGAAPAPTPETRQVAAAGWLGATVHKRAGETVFVLARNGVDGMCRSMAYQIFVFVGGTFAGTLAPQPMDARTDGSGYIEEAGPRRFTAIFARYRADDPLCCPSRTSTVTYEIRDSPGGQANAEIVVPLTVVTKRTQ